MKLLKQLLLIILFYILGEVLSFIIKQLIPGVFIPGSLLGMLLLFILLILNVIKFEWIDNVGEFFLNNMAFFFVPSAVSLLAYFDIISVVLGRMILILFLSFCITFIAVGYSTKLTLKLLNKKGDKYD